MTTKISGSPRNLQNQPQEIHLFFAKGFQNKDSINSLSPPLSGYGIKNSENMSSPRLDAPERAATPADHTGFSAITWEAHGQVADSSQREEAALRQSTTKSPFPTSGVFMCSPSLGLIFIHC